MEVSRYNTSLFTLKLVLMVVTFSRAVSRFLPFVEILLGMSPSKTCVSDPRRMCPFFSHTRNDIRFNNRDTFEQ